MYSTRKDVSVTVESIHYSTLIRACTGFDGGFEVWEAIRGLRDRVINLEPKFKRRR